MHFKILIENIQINNNNTSNLDYVMAFQTILNIIFLPINKG